MRGATNHTKRRHWTSIQPRQKIIGLTIIIGIVSYIGIQQSKGYIQGSEFRRTEEYVEQITQKMSAASDKASVKPNNYCYYMSRKYNKGPRICVVSTSIRIKNVTINEANTFLSKSAKITNSNPLSGLLNNGQTTFRAVEVTQTITQALDKRLDGCGANYTYFDNELVVAITCSGEALKEYYPIGP